VRRKADIGLRRSYAGGRNRAEYDERSVEAVGGEGPWGGSLRELERGGGVRSHS